MLRGLRKKVCGLQRGLLDVALPFISAMQTIKDVIVAPGLSPGTTGSQYSPFAPLSTPT